MSYHVVKEDKILAAAATFVVKLFAFSAHLK
jgi:hypothetical protein